MVNVRLLHPTFEYLFFDDAQVESFIREHFPEYQHVYDAVRFPIQKYDLFRYLAVYHYGGFYLDLDVFLAQDLTPFLGARCVFPFEELTALRYFRRQFEMDWQIGNYAFGAEPGHPYLAAIIDNCLRAIRDPSWVAPMMQGIPGPIRSQFYILNSSGPGLVSRTFAENPQLAREVTVLFPDDVRDPSGWHKFGSIGVHQMVASWRKRQSFFSRRVLRLWDAWTLHRILADCKNRGTTREAPRPAGWRRAI